MIDLFSSPPDVVKDTECLDIDPQSVPNEDFGPIVTPEEQEAIHKFYEANPSLKQIPHGTLPPPQEPIVSVTYKPSSPFTVCSDKFNEEDAWIQTYSGRRFNPTNPYVDAIVIQDIAHSLSMQCRFSGHCKEFYSVAQHSVMVSYICNMDDAFWGLMHDASEAYLVDIPRPLKKSGKFDAYNEFEARMMQAICKRFGLPEKEPPSVKKADQILLATEARDLMSPLRSDWVQPCEPLPWKIEALPPKEAKRLFMKRFFELTNSPSGYAHYLSYENK